ncbi:MAG: preprotein translocase subunit SecE [Candidatus Izemoplasmataceae bacterium]
MAKKVEEKSNKVIEILRKEYPFERMLLGVLGAIVIVLGVYLVEGRVLEIRYTDLWIFNSQLKITIFSIFVILIGVVSFLLAVAPFFIPSFAEMRKVSWPTKKVIANHSARVFGFIIVIGLFFILYESVFNPLFIWLNTIGA